MAEHTATAIESTDRSLLRGSLWMLGAAALGATIDASVKSLQGDFPTAQIVLLRLLLALPFVLVFAHLSGGLGSIRPRRWRWHLLRACCAAGTTFGFFYALGEVPLLLVATIGFAAPLMIAVLSRPILGEPVNAGRWLGIGLGFGGVLIALQPGSTQWHPAMLAALGGTLCWALLALSARRIGHEEPTGAMVLFTMPVSLALALILAVPAWVAPSPQDWLLFGIAGFGGASLHYCMVFAYRAAAAATVAPIEYTGLIWAATLGWVIWGEVPTPATWAGAMAIVAGGLIVLRGR